MSGLFSPLLAEAVRTRFEWGRIQADTDCIVPIVAAVLLMVFVRAMYRRDAVDISPALGWLLTALRTVAFFGLLVLYLQPQWRTERETVSNSRVLLLADASSSMGLTDAGPSGSGGTSRIQQVAAALKQGDLLRRLRQTHDVTVLRFDRELKRIVTLEKGAEGKSEDSPAGDRAKRKPNTAIGDAKGDSPLFAERKLGQLPRKLGQGPDIDWDKALMPNGQETRLGQALRQLVYEEQNAPVSGIVVFSDGGQNAGIAPEAAVELAREAKIPLFPIGLGSDRLPMNVRVYKVEAVPRAYPGDPYTVSGLIQAQGRSAELAGKPVTVELLIRKSEDGKAQPGSGTVVDRQQVILGAGGESVPVKFEVTPDDTGRRTLCLRIVPPPGDHNPADDFRETEVEVVDRKDRVLLLAGGPSRDYGFLRPLLFRDKSIVVDVLLQTAQPGMSQEANQILGEFPTTREEMFAYDGVVAFDPDWQSLTAEQIGLLESWVAEQAGGLIVVAGPVHMGEAVGGWIHDPAMSKIRALLPVEFQHRATSLDISNFASRDPWPLDFTREGLEAEFLWLADDQASSQQAWASMGGVYSCFPVRGPKSAATVYARYSDPQAAVAGEAPVYMAEQFYGSGRVFYLGSGELWRLRRSDTAYFDRLYTRLIRHVSQGRLLRQSSRGVLMVAQDQYSLGSTVEIRAQLTNAQFTPLEAPAVTLEVFKPDGTVQAVSLRPDPSRAGTFAGQITVLEEGVYRLDLPVPDSSDERITRRIQVSVPDLERQNPQRDDKLLVSLADGTGGKYYRSISEALSSTAPEPLVAKLKDRTKTIITPAAPDPFWEETWLRWMMYTLCGLLCLEWLIRRLVKLA